MLRHVPPRAGIARAGQSREVSVSLHALVVLGVKTSIVLTVVGLGLSASLDDAISLFRAPERLFRSLLAMMVIVPLFAVIVASVFDLDPAVKIALAALSISPVPPLWPRRSLRAGGEMSYTIGLLVATALLSIVTVPLGLLLFESIFSIPLRMHPLDVAYLAFVTVLLPLVAGMVVRRRLPRFADRAARPVSLLSIGLLGVSIVPILITIWPAITTLVGDGTLLTMLAFVLVGVIGGHALGGPADEDRCTLVLASASRHPGIALAIAQVNFPNEHLLAPAIVLYLLVSGLATTPYVRWTRRQTREHHRPLMALR